MTVSSLILMEQEFMFKRLWVKKKIKKIKKKNLEDTANQGRCFYFVFLHRFNDTAVFKLIYLQNCVIRL